MALIALPGLAWAEGDRAASVEASWATFSTVGKKMGTKEPPALSPDYGLSVAGMYEHALSTDLSLRGELAGAYFSGGQQKGETDTSYALLGDVGGVFRFDVLKYVPYAFAGVGGVLSTGGPIDQGSEFVVVVGGGLDVLASRERSWGIEGRLASFGGNITIFTFGLRGSVRWGYW